MFKPIDKTVSFPEQEERILRFWKDRQIYEKSLKLRENGPRFVFYEGPPTANGLPHPGHCLTRAMKDLFPRYRAMRGFHCERKAGWDTHGLPVEVEVCKQLGIHSKEEIEDYGIEPFIQKCQQSVWRYMQEWERLTERLGFWIKLDEAYVTYHQSYIESVWWSLKQLFDRGLLYQGHKIVWWWAQGGTALSSGEVGQGYREVDDPSIFVLFPLLDESNSSLIVWTTTPWTMPSNQFAAVNPQLEYARVTNGDSDQQFYLAKDLVETVAEKTGQQLTIVATCPGSHLIGKRYAPPFDFYYKHHRQAMGQLRDGGQEHLYWRVVGAEFVTTDNGSGIVHQAPAFGEVDYEVLTTEQDRFEPGQGPDLFCAVGPDGKFTHEAPDFTGQWVKDADKAITRAIKNHGRLLHQEQYRHDYPFCWRAENDPLIQYPRKSWFIKTTAYREKMLQNNRQINWLPEHIRDGRFGKFLETNVDWALSRERFWGTPLPIWVCDATGQMEAIDSFQCLLDKPGISGTEVWKAAQQANSDLPDDLQVHKPYIDAVTYDSPFQPGARMRRVSEVIDCWYDSGAMPFAQWGYPHKNSDRFQQQFPADFISEAIDQTRGWFYSLLAISTIVFGESDDAASNPDHNHSQQYPFPHPYRNCIVLGLMLSEWFESKQGTDNNIALTNDEATETFGAGNFAQRVGKMSKSKRNYREPNEIFNRYGADVLRWYFFANQPPWTSIRYSEPAIKDSIPEFILRLWNVVDFFIIYANIDGFDPGQEPHSGLFDAAGLGFQLTEQDWNQFKNRPPVDQRSELDRWVISELNRTIATVTERMDAYDNFVACDAINRFVDGLSNWYVRRSRNRFWSDDPQDPNKLDAYWTLYECLVETAKLIAPFVPFLAEEIWQRLVAVFGDQVRESVHLCDFPTPAGGLDAELSANMNLLRDIASLGRAARMDAKLKVRQPLAGVTVVLNHARPQAWLEAHEDILKHELNVKSIQYTTDAGDYVTYQIQPNFKRLGQRVRGLMPKVKQLLAEADGAQLLEELQTNGNVTLPIDNQTVELDDQDISVRLQANPGWTAAQAEGIVVILATELTDALIREGLARDIIRNVQGRRKELNLEFTDRIQLTLLTDSPEMNLAIEECRQLIQQETLAVEILKSTPAGADQIDVQIGEHKLTVAINVVNQQQIT